MFARRFLLPLLLAPSSAYPQDTPETKVVCLPGHCLQGTSNVTLGATFSASGFSIPLHLLPGQYDDRTSPQYLHDVITSSSAAMLGSPGFTNSTLLPLDLKLQPGVATYSSPRYSGQAAFNPLPEGPGANTSLSLSSTRSFAIAANVRASISTGPATNVSLAIWDSIPDVNQLPSNVGTSLSLVGMESTLCSPSCSSGGLCLANGACRCAAGFAGSSCEQCEPGLFGPTCQPCPPNCDSCDEGISGSGRCLKPTIPNKPSECDCANGVCGADGKCTCTTGFETADDGVACGKCSSGFFRTSTGDCKACSVGCTQCSDTTGACATCKSGFVRDTSDTTRCNPPAQVKSDGQICPAGSFASGGDCTPCDSVCETCTGSSPNDCSKCSRGRVFLDGACVTPDSDGVCPGSVRIADNVKNICDSCGAKCTACRISNFTEASTIDTRQCTECIPGSFLLGGECVDACPDGTFISSDLKSCQACDTSCRTCSGSATTCLTCSSNQLATNGTCVASCPSSTFASTSNTQCITCHPDCASCSGGEFNKCTACPHNRPVLVNGRCLPTCTKTQYFDSSSQSCQACDSSCSSCSGPGPSNCLACSSDSNVLRQGRCEAAGCESIIPGLGVCLSDLVVLPSPTGPAPPPTVSGIDAPTKAKFKLEWWQILLMVLGGVFIFVIIGWCCWRRQRKQREGKTKLFVQDQKQSGWRWHLVRFGEKLFGHRPSVKMAKDPSQPTKEAAAGSQRSWSLQMDELKAAEEARSPNHGNLVISQPVTLRPKGAQQDVDIVNFIGSYNRGEPNRKPSRPLSDRYAPTIRSGYAVYHTTSRPLSNASERYSLPKQYGHLQSSHSRRSSTDESDRYTQPSRAGYSRRRYSRPMSDVSDEGYSPSLQNGKVRPLGSRPLSDANERYEASTRNEFLRPPGQRPVSGSSQISEPSIYSQMTGKPPNTPDESQTPALKSKFSMDTLAVNPPQKKNHFWR